LNAGGVSRNCDSEPISGQWLHHVLSTLRPPGVINMVLLDHGKLWHLPLVVSGGACWRWATTTKCLWQEVSMLCQRQQNSI